MKPGTNTLMVILNVIAWVVFIGLLIIAGSILISYIVSINHPAASRDLYKGMDLSAYREYGFANYTFIAAYKIIFYVLQAYTAFLITKVLTRVNIAKPFNAEVVQTMHKMSYTILLVWVTAVVHNIHMYVFEKTLRIPPNYISTDSILLAAIVYVLAMMFKRGAEIQSEIELTV